jgi:uncharacterized membrane protein YqjE
MPTHATNGGQPSLGTAVKQVAEHASTLVRLELELASLELRKKAASLGVGIGLLVGAGVFALFTFGFLFATIAAGLATAMPWWLALLIVTVFLLVVTAVLALVGQRLVKSATPPVPEQAIAEAKITSNALRGE